MDIIEFIQTKNKNHREIYHFLQKDKANQIQNQKLFQFFQMNLLQTSKDLLIHIGLSQIKKSHHKDNIVYLMKIEKV